MPLLHVALQDGFEGDRVIVRVNGREVFNKSNVRTRYQISFADSCELDVDEGSVNVEILLPVKNLQQTVALPVAGPTYVGISRREDRIESRVSQEPFGYL